MDSRTAFFSLRPQISGSVVEAIAMASERQAKETDAVIKIQSVYCMFRVRREFLRVKNAILYIQRMYRGHLQRKRVSEIRKKIDWDHEKAVYEYYATRIQATFRGFYIRRYVDNFYARKRYIQETTRASAEVREVALCLLEKQMEERDAENRAREELRYKEATKKLHHMLSTVSVSGLYRNPTSVTGANTVYGTNVETDIRRNAADFRRQDHANRVRENVMSVFQNKRETPEQHLIQESKVVEPKADEPFLPFSVLRGAWNRSGVQGCTLPPIAPPADSKTKGAVHASTVNGRLVNCKKTTHACIEDYTPFYDKETADLKRCVDAKTLQSLHGSKPFVVPAHRRVPL